LSRWSDPQRRIDRYSVLIGYRFHFDPRVIDEWTIGEFDQFALLCDQFDQQDQAQARGRG
jgi:hypothetical protein